MGHQIMRQPDGLLCVWSWAQEIEGVDIPALPDPEDEERWFVINADGSGDVFEDQPDGFESEEEAQRAITDLLESPGHSEASREDFEIESREVALDDLSEDALDEWREEVRQAVTDVLGNAPY